MQTSASHSTWVAVLVPGDAVCSRCHRLLCFAIQFKYFIFFPEHPSRIRTATPEADPAKAVFSGSLFFPVRVTQWRFNGHRPRKSVPQTPQRTCVSRWDHRGDPATPTGGPDPARELCSPRSEVTGTCCRARLPAPHPPAAPYAEDDHAEDDGDHPEEPGALEVAAAIADPLRAHRRRHPAGAAANRRSARRAPPPLRPPRGGRGRGGAAPSVTERRCHWSDRWRHLQRAGDAATGAAGAGEPCPAAGAPPGPRPLAGAALPRHFLPGRPPARGRRSPPRHAAGGGEAGALSGSRAGPGAALPLQPGRENRRLRNSTQKFEWAFQLDCLRINDNDQCYGWRKSRKCRKSGDDSECSWICTVRSVAPSFPGALPIPAPLPLVPSPAANGAAAQPRVLSCGTAGEQPQRERRGGDRRCHRPPGWRRGQSRVQTCTVPQRSPPAGYRLAVVLLAGPK